MDMSIDFDEELKPLKTIISSFSEFVKDSKQDIYTNDDKIPFNKRNKEYKTLLKNEFKNAVNEFLLNLKS